MRITVFGATGGTGIEVVRQALAAGYQVTAVVRDPARLPVTGAGLTVVTGDVLDPAAMAGPIRDADAVICAIGQRGGPGARSDLLAASTTSIIAAMRTTGVRRLIVVTASGHVRDSHDDFLTRAIAKPVLRRLLRSGFADFAETDRIVADSGLQWTIMRPSRLTDRGHRPYRTAVDHTLRGGMSISRADLARATLHAADDPGAAGHAIAVGY